LLEILVLLKPILISEKINLQHQRILSILKNYKRKRAFFSTNTWYNIWVFVLTNLKKANKIY